MGVCMVYGVCVCGFADKCVCMFEKALEKEEGVIQQNTVFFANIHWKNKGCLLYIETKSIKLNCLENFLWETV